MMRQLEVLAQQGDMVALESSLEIVSAVANGSAQAVAVQSGALRAASRCLVVRPLVIYTQKPRHMSRGFMICNTATHLSVICV